MRIVKIYGGLGNQMFQYAFSLALADGEREILYDCSDTEMDETHNGLELERVFGLELPRAAEPDVRCLATRPQGLLNRLARKYLTKRTHVIDRKFEYQSELLALGGDRYYEGYWQDERYFKDLEAAVREAYRFPTDLGDRNERALRGLRRPIASVHVRRGDYLGLPNLNICTPDYYVRAIKELRDGGSAAMFMVFSEDIEYCRWTLGLSDEEAVFVDWNTGPDSWRDMAMMARCDAHVIANSSFSWWGAWLDPRPTKSVIAPMIWNRRQIDSGGDRYYRFSYDHVVPPEWRRMPL